ncbi:unnamed protein product [Orchesella dallaii]|uniref:Uncharacterized protein n=1 Tax=Orchesella dallaii TaxID=48710 RepID=A0ABP1S1T4_9HEXA
MGSSSISSVPKLVPLSKQEEEGKKMRRIAKLYTRNLNKFSFSKEDKLQRETVLLQLPYQMKESGSRGVDNVVIFPYGTFYHGLGYSDDPLTAFICIGHLIPEKKAKSSEFAEEMEDGEVMTEEFLTRSVESDNRMRQALLLEVNDALISKENNFQRFYKQVTLTRQGRLYFVYEPSHNPTATPVECILEAKSFLQVQVSRLIKFYCHLEDIFWIFSQSVLHWARSHDVIQRLGKNDVDGLTQDHIILLIIFYLVRHKVIPSLALLQNWTCTPFYVDGINTGFCDDVDFIKKKFKGKVSTAKSSEPSLQRVLQHLHLFFSEISSLNFLDYGISPATGAAFAKSTFNGTKNNNLQRRLDTKTALCIQHIFDSCQNTTRKVGEAWITKLQSKARTAALKMTPSIWRKHIVKATNIFFATS